MEELPVARGWIVFLTCGCKDSTIPGNGTSGKARFEIQVTEELIGVGCEICVAEEGFNVIDCAMNVGTTPSNERLGKVAIQIYRLLPPVGLRYEKTSTLSPLQST